MQTITLGNAEFEGQNNAYLLTPGDETVLLDTGIDNPAVRQDLERGLEQHGYGFADIDIVVLTHWHYDHAGLAGDIQAESGATVYAHEIDAPLIRQDDDALTDLRERQLERFREWGMPPPAFEMLSEHMEKSDEVAGTPADVDAVADGDRLQFDGITLETVHTPGHTAGHCCFAFDVEGGEEAFVGDALLPVYTPNVGGADVRLDHPLERYLGTLERIADRGFVRALPGHRDVIESPAERATAIVDHHRERTERILDILAEHGPADAWTVSDHLFGELEGIHVLHGPGEAFAHLDHLRRNGVVEETGGRYRLLDADPDLVALL